MTNVRMENIAVPVAGIAIALPGLLAVPARSRGLVIFAHGSGSSRLSPRNRMVADRLNGAHLATLLFDLLAPAEAEDRSAVFDIPLLAERLGQAIRWARAEPGLSSLPCGLFGASTGGGAALLAAAQAPGLIRAVVSRGGRPDLARGALPRVKAPTLLILGENDRAVLGLNRAALAELRCEKRLEIVPGAGHLFEEAGALERVADLAADWFAAYLAARHAPA